MFANLKNKILDEVKASPQKFQQFAQAAQAAVSSASSTASESVSGSDNFFSITEEDTPQNSPLKAVNKSNNKNAGEEVATQLSTSGATVNNPTVSHFTNSNASIPSSLNRTRKLSNSSVASDVSFRLPSYDSPAVYHLQSDLESASEMEDSVGPSSKLDLIGKEQLHDAYRKALDRYQKYRTRYTDLAKRYRDLERDSTKARAVLVETQDKAIRRISELREQCILEQQAKAHLEEALRMEMDDMQCKIKAYQTKLKLLGENPDVSMKNTSLQNTNEEEKENATNSESLIQLDDNLISLNGNIDSSPEMKEKSTTDNRIAKLEELLNERNKEISLLNEKIKESDKVVENLKKREEENSILLAQNKLMVHSELENKEKEMKTLKSNLIEAENTIQQSEKEKVNLKKQITELNEMQSKLKHAIASKQDVEAKLISADHLMSELRKELKEKETVYENAKITLEEKLKSVSQEFGAKLNNLEAENNRLNETLQRYNKAEIDLANIDNELNRTKIENNDLRSTVEQLRRDNSELSSNINDYKEKLQNAAKSLEEANSREVEIKETLEKYENELKSIKDELKNTSSSRKTFKGKLKPELLQSQSKKTDSENISALKQALQKNTEELNSKIDDLQTQLNDKDNELKNAKLMYEKLKNEYEEFSSTENSKEDFLNEEFKALRVSLEESEKKINDIKAEKETSEQLMEKEKAELKSQVTNILQEISRMEGEMTEVRKSHSKLEEEKRNLEKNFEKMTKQKNQENSENVEKLGTVVQETGEKLKQLESKLQSVESENSQLAEKNCLLVENYNRLENQAKENEVTFKKEKNTLNELLRQAELDYNTAVENEKILNEKMSQILDENSRLHNAKEMMEHEYRSLQDQLETKEKEKLCLLDTNKCLEEELRALREENEQFRRETNNLNEMCNSLRDDLENATAKETTEKEKCEKLVNELKTVQKTKETLEKELVELREELTHSNSEIKKLKAFEDENLKIKEELSHEQKCNDELKLDLDSIKKQMLEDVAKCENSFKSQIFSVESERAALQDKLNILLEESNKLKSENEECQEEIKNLNVNNESKIRELEVSLTKANGEILSLKESAKNSIDMGKKLEAFEQLKIENEYLTTLTNQVENNLQNEKEKMATYEAEIADLKEKLKSQQCELYVLSEEKVKYMSEMDLKNTEIETFKEKVTQIEKILSEQRLDFQRQEEHNRYIAGQNDVIQKELLVAQKKLTEAERICGETRSSYEEVLNENQNLLNKMNAIETTSKLEIEKSKQDILNNQMIINDLTKELMQATKLLEKLQNVESENQEFKKTIEELEVKINDYNNERRKSSVENEERQENLANSDNLRKMNEILQKELENLKQKSLAEISNLTQEIDDLTSHSKGMSEKVSDYDKLKDENELLQLELVKFKENHRSRNEVDIENNFITTTLQGENKFRTLCADEENFPQESEVLRKEKNELEKKLNKIMDEVQDVSNRNLFLEQKCENYLILEQSNERLKLANEKLSRQLDETLVSMQHNEGIQANTEFEYLRNIMFQYLTGTVTGNNETLVKVIAAVLKFSPQQTQVALEKEHQRHTLTGQLNNLL